MIVSFALQHTSTEVRGNAETLPRTSRRNTLRFMNTDRSFPIGLPERIQESASKEYRMVCESKCNNCRPKKVLLSGSISTKGTNRRYAAKWIGPGGHSGQRIPLTVHVLRERLWHHSCPMHTGKKITMRKIEQKNSFSETEALQPCRGRHTEARSYPRKPLERVRQPISQDISLARLISMVPWVGSILEVA
jgi:hypothetical protein